MEREVIPYSTREAWLAERAKDLTSTVIPALFNMSPYLTAFEAWHRAHGNVIVEIEPNASMTWGSRLEPIIAEGIAADEGWRIRKKSEYMRLPEHRVGSSFDYETDAPALLEIKSVNSHAFRRGWTMTDFGLEAPPHIEIQCQVEMLVSGFNVLYIGALTDNDTVHVLRREFQPDVGEAILQAAARFWNGPEPSPDFTRDAAFVAKLHGHADPGTSIEADAELAELMQRHYDIGRQIDVLGDERDALKARMLTKIDTIEKVYAGSLTLHAGEGKDVLVKEHVRRASRQFRITSKE